ncbi:alpha-tocopherol transfer protein-like [Amblyomma americanum]
MKNKKTVAAAADMAQIRENVPRNNLEDALTTEADALSHLFELIAGEPSLDCPTDEDFLLKYLRGRKYNTHDAFRTIKKYFKMRRNNPDMFDALDPYSIPFDFVCRKHQLVTVSREKDANGRAVILLKIGTWNTDICSLNEFFRTAIAHVEHLLLDEEVQLNGVVFMMDFKGLSIYHLLHYTPPVIKRLFSLMQDCYPLRLKGIYATNNPPLFDILFTIAKRFMKAKLVRRTHLFGYDLNMLRNLVPDDVIPEEFGGFLESYDYDAMEEDLKNHAEYFREISKRGYHDEEKNNA